MFSDIKPHLVELRNRIFISVVALIAGFVLSFIFYQPILHWVTSPLDKALTEAGKVVKKSKEGEWSVDGNGSKGNITKKTLPAIDKTKKPISLVDKAIKNSDLIINSPESTKTEIAIANSLKDLAIYTKELAKINEEKNSDGVFWGSITTHQLGGVFVVALKVSLYASIFLALPIILWQGWLFVAPGLYDNEKKMAVPFLVGVTIMFAIGVMFAYYVVTPFGFQFLVTFGAFLYTPLINIEDYIGFFAKILFGFGLAFELPMIVYFLAFLGLVTEKTLISFFKYAIVLIFIVAALLTPPDVITQLLMALPLIILYGVSIIVAKIINPYKEDNDIDEDEPNESNNLNEQKQLDNE